MALTRDRSVVILWHFLENFLPREEFDKVKAASLCGGLMAQQVESNDMLSRILYVFGLSLNTNSLNLFNIIFEIKYKFLP